jgi:hypothetical protein
VIGPQIGDVREMTPRERHQRAAKRYAVGLLARTLRISGVTKESVEQLEADLDSAAMGLVADDLLAKGAI